MRQEQIVEAYDYCRRVTQRASKTFYWGSMFLPPSKRKAIWAVYAFCRVVDDIVDEAIEAQAQRPGHLSGSRSPEEELEYWRCSMERIYQRGGSDAGPIPPATSRVYVTHDPTMSGVSATTSSPSARIGSR